jgi:hypothetical protein
MSDTAHFYLIAVPLAIVVGAPVGMIWYFFF